MLLATKLALGARKIRCMHVFRGVASFDFVSGQGVSKNAAVLSNAELGSLLWAKCNISTDLNSPAARDATLSPEKQMMRLRMLSPHLTVNSTQVWFVKLDLGFPYNVPKIDSKMHMCMLLHHLNAIKARVGGDLLKLAPTLIMKAADGC